MWIGGITEDGCNWFWIANDGQLTPMTKTFWGENQPDYYTKNKGTEEEMSENRAEYHYFILDDRVAPCSCSLEELYNCFKKVNPHLWNDHYANEKKGVICQNISPNAPI